jgi:hypothetical protein
MRKGKLIGKILGIALVFVVIGATFGGLLGAVSAGATKSSNNPSEVSHSPLSSLASAFDPGGAMLTVSESSTPQVIQSSYASTPPVIDGLLSLSEWGSPVITKTLDYFNCITGQDETHEMLVYFMNDNAYLYVAIRITNEDFESEDIQLDDVDVIELYFDNDNDEVIEANEDIKNFWNLEYSDWFYNPTEEGSVRWSEDERADGIGAASHSTHSMGDYIYEFEIPLDSGDIHDLAITTSSIVGIKILYREMYYNATDEYWHSKGEDGWPAVEGRFDGTTYGKLVLSSAPPEGPDLAVDIISTDSFIIGERASVTIRIENKGDASIPAKSHTVKVCLIDYEFKQPSSWRFGDSYQAIKWGQNSWCNSFTIDLPELRPSDSQIEEIEFLIPEPVFEDGAVGIWADTLTVYVSQSLPELYEDGNKSNNGDEQDIAVSPSVDMEISCVIYWLLPYMIDYFGVEEGITLNGELGLATNLFSLVKNVRQKDFKAVANNLVNIALKVAAKLSKNPIAIIPSLAKGLWEGAKNCAALALIFSEYYWGASKIVGNWLWSWVDCPVDILIMDAQGNRAGFMDGIIYEEIEGSEVVVVDDRKLILLPWQSGYSVALMGTGSGTMDFYMLLPAGESIAKIVEYDDVPVSQATEAIVDIGPENPEYLMEIDNNGDGQVDAVRSPDLINTWPNIPTNCLPADHSTRVPIHPHLSWTGGDPDAGDTVTYDVYFGTSETPPLVSNSQSGTTYDPGTLAYNTTYYWQIVATDNQGASTTGPLWDFTAGVPQDEPSPEVGLASLIADGKLVIAYNFDPFTTVPTAVAGWTWFDPTLPPVQNNLAKLHKNTAYWVKVTEECWLTYGTQTYHLAAGWNNPVWLGC